jgi:hypothetical protein
MSAYSAAVLADSPAAYWPLGEASGTAAADAAGSNTGTYSGSVALGAAPLMVGDGHTSANFTGGQMAAPDAAALRLGGGDITIEMWLKPSSFGAYVCIIDNVNRAYSLFPNPGGSALDEIYIGFGATGGGGSAFGGSAGFLPTSMATGVAQQLVVTRSGTTLTGYRNGAQGTPATWTSGTTNSSTGVTIAGNPSTGGALYQGLIGHVSLYPSALSAARVLAHYNAGITAVPPPLRSRRSVARSPAPSYGRF